MTDVSVNLVPSPVRMPRELKSFSTCNLYVHFGNNLYLICVCFNDAVFLTRIKINNNNNINSYFRLVRTLSKGTLRLPMQAKPPNSSMMWAVKYEEKNTSSTTPESVPQNHK